MNEEKVLLRSPGQAEKSQLPEKVEAPHEEISAIQKCVRTLVDLVRTAPLKTAEMLVGSLLLWNFMNDPMGIKNEAIDAASLGFGIAMVMQGLTQTVKQLRIRQKVKRKCREQSYSDEGFEKYTYAWCVRQNVRTVLRRTGDLEAFDQLCLREKEKGNGEDFWLPYL